MPIIISELKSLVGDGETRLFPGTDVKQGSEPLFYRVAADLSIADRPLWVDAPDILDKPHAPIDGLNGKPLSAETEYRFLFKSPEGAVAELYRIGIGLFLISNRVASVILTRDPDSLTTAPAIVEVAGRKLDDFVVALPTRVLDAVDTQRTDVQIERLEVLPRSGRFRTSVRFPSGIVIRTDLERAVQNFIGSYDGNWWWRHDLVEAVRSLSIRGLRAVKSTSSLIGGAD